jgi:ABC-type glutathione transport system ATPase component
MSQLDPHETGLLEARSLGKSHRENRLFSRTKNTVDAFSDVNLSIRRGVRLAIVGESGAGKSTLARCLALLEKPTQGQIVFNGRNLLNLTKDQLFPFRRKIQMVFQDPASALNPWMTAADIVSEPLLIQQEGSRREQRDEALQLMEAVGLSAAWADRCSVEFSGGQKQRLAIARALALTPDILILDESLSSLDAATQDSILELLSDLQVKHLLTYILVSHDLGLCERFADEVVVMHRGRIVEQKTAPELFSQPEHRYTRKLLAAMPSMEQIRACRLAEQAR